MVGWRSVNPHISDALWLTSVGLVVQYFTTAARPLQAGMLTLIPFIGTLGLVAGLVMGIAQRRRPLFLFFFPFVVSECYVAIATWFHGRLPGNTSLVLICMFTFLQLALIGYVAYRVRGARFAALALTVFSLSYAWFAYFFGQMAWTDTWL